MKYLHENLAMYHNIYKYYTYTTSSHLPSSIVEHSENPTKAQGEKTLLPQLAETMKGLRKEDPHTQKKLPVGIDVPECLAELGMEKYATEMIQAVGDCAITAFYYLLQVLENIVKKKRNKTKQTVQLKLEDTMFLSG